MTLARTLTGVSGILVTPFDADGHLAPERQAPVVERAVAAGVQVLTANGNTGEFYGLTLDEAVRDGAGRRAAISQGGCRWSPVWAAGSATRCRWPRLGRLRRRRADDPSAARSLRRPARARAPIFRPCGTVTDLPLILYLQQRRDRHRRHCRALYAAGRRGREMGHAEPDEAEGRDGRRAGPHHLDRRARRDLGAGLLFGRCTRLHLGADQRLARTVGRDQRRAARRAIYAGARALIAGMQVFEDIRAEEQGGANVPASRPRSG
jgi:4-hydroxy-tetrahydrodipicolinate synthase